MSTFKLPEDLAFNTDRIANPAAFAIQKKAASWLYLCGEEFAAMEGGMSYAQVQAAVLHAANIIADPPRTLTVEIARAQVAALDALPRPTVITCRAGPRSSAAAYMYAGLKAGAAPADVLAAAERDGAPFSSSADLREWVRQSIEAQAGETKK